VYAFHPLFVVKSLFFSGDTFCVGSDLVRFPLERGGARERCVAARHTQFSQPQPHLHVDLAGGGLVFFGGLGFLFGLGFRLREVRRLFSSWLSECFRLVPVVVGFIVEFNCNVFHAELKSEIMNGTPT
jgi:hypothetical protein